MMHAGWHQCRLDIGERVCKRAVVEVLAQRPEHDSAKENWPTGLLVEEADVLMLTPRESAAGVYAAVRGMGEATSKAHTWVK